ncbi:hypothetical protein M885DRAFT_618983, partial [Pelagophyceae sp. CCMP2097]
GDRSGKTRPRTRVVAWRDGRAVVVVGGARGRQVVRGGYVLYGRDAQRWKGTLLLRKARRHRQRKCEPARGHRAVRKRHGSAKRGRGGGSEARVGPDLRLPRLFTVHRQDGEIRCAAALRRRHAVHDGAVAGQGESRFAGRRLGGAARPARRAGGRVVARPGGPRRYRRARGKKDASLRHTLLGQGAGKLPAKVPDVFEEARREHGQAGHLRRQLGREVFQGHNRVVRQLSLYHNRSTPRDSRLER